VVLPLEIYSPDSETAITLAWPGAPAYTWYALHVYAENGIVQAGYETLAVKTLKDSITVSIGQGGWSPVFLLGVPTAATAATPATGAAIAAGVSPATGQKIAVAAILAVVCVAGVATMAVKSRKA